MPKVYVTRTAEVAELVISAPPLNLFDAQLAPRPASVAVGFRHECEAP